MYKQYVQYVYVSVNKRLNAYNNIYVYPYVYLNIFI